MQLALRALANDKRILILEWLKRPRGHFPRQVEGDLVEDGVCGVFIADKLGISQPTVSELETRAKVANRTPSVGYDREHASKRLAAVARIFPKSLRCGIFARESWRVVRYRRLTSADSALRKSGGLRRRILRRRRSK